MFRFDNVIFHVHILEDFNTVKKQIPTKLIYTVNATLGRYPSSSRSVGKDFNRWYRTAYGRKMNLDSLPHTICKHYFHMDQRDL